MYIMYVVYARILPSAHPATRLFPTISAGTPCRPPFPLIVGCTLHIIATSSQHRPRRREFVCQSSANRLPMCCQCAAAVPRTPVDRPSPVIPVRHNQVVPCAHHHRDKTYEAGPESATQIASNCFCTFVLPHRQWPRRRHAATLSQHSSSNFLAYIWQFTSTLSRHLAADSGIRPTKPSSQYDVHDTLACHHLTSNVQATHVCHRRHDHICSISTVEPCHPADLVVLWDCIRCPLQPENGEAGRQWRAIGAWPRIARRSAAGPIAAALPLDGACRRWSGTAPQPWILPHVCILVELHVGKQ